MRLLFLRIMGKAIPNDQRALFHPQRNAMPAEDQRIGIALTLPPFRPALGRIRNPEVAALRPLVGSLADGGGELRLSVNFGMGEYRFQQCHKWFLPNAN
jgi:hypothetical protein